MKTIYCADCDAIFHMLTGEVCPMCWGDDIEEQEEE